jgi:predicted nucleotidyltransferase
LRSANKAATKGSWPDSTDEASVAKQAVSALYATLGERLIAVVLYGSRARGDARADSDWDLLVLAEGLPEDLFERHLLLNQLLPLAPGDGITALAKTPAEFEARLPSLYLDLALDGQILYDPRGYATERLTALRRLIESTGLYRERTKDGDIWRWTREPPRGWALAWPERPRDRHEHPS